MRITKENLKMLCWCLFSAIFLCIVLQKLYTVIAYDTPKELREMNTIAFAHQFAHGNNPYSPSALEHETPPVTSIYGFLVPLLMSPFIRLLTFTSFNTLQICELLTLIVEVIGALSFYRLYFKLLKIKAQIIPITCSYGIPTSFYTTSPRLP